MLVYKPLYSEGPLMNPHPALPHAHPADVGLIPDRLQRLMDVLHLQNCFCTPAKRISLA